MPQQHPTSSSESIPAAPAARRERRRRPCRVLIVNSNTETCAGLASLVGDERTALYQAASINTAVEILENTHIDIVIVDEQLPDGRGVEFIKHLAPTCERTSLILTANQPGTDLVIDAMRAGAIDCLTLPLDPEHVTVRINQAKKRSRRKVQLANRVRRLRRVCRKLNSAREEITQQVDVLCADLVTAYQELAEQMQSVVHTSEFTAVAGNELDLENLLRKSLEYLLDKAGPTNAAIFLPATIDEFSLGGYVNYDWSHGSPDMLLQQLADTIAPQVADVDEVVHLNDNATIREWIGNDAEFLLDSEILSVCCKHGDEPLAVIVMFRERSKPFTNDIIETCDAVAPLLAEYLAKIIRIHHRHLPDLDEDDMVDDDDAGLGI